MNALLKALRAIIILLVAPVAAATAPGCGTLPTPESDGGDTVVTTTVTTDDAAESDPDTATETPSGDDDAAYSDDGAGTLTIYNDYNPYPGSVVGFFADEAGVEDGWTRAVATVLQSEEGDLFVNLSLLGEGQSTRWALATIDENNAPVNWLWESGIIGDNLAEHDDLGLTIWLQECVGDELVDKLNFCTRLTSNGIVGGDCWGTYVEPASCTDADSDGDVDPDADGGGDEDPDCADADGDGYADVECGGDDCDDGWEYTHPDALEYNDDEDNDCDGTVDDGCTSGTATNAFCG